MTIDDLERSFVMMEGQLVAKGYRGVIVDGLRILKKSYSDIFPSEGPKLVALGNKA